MDSEKINQIHELISAGKFEKAIDLFNNEHLDTNALALKSRLQLLQQKKIKGIISHENEIIETNNIVNSLLELLNSNSYDSSL